MESGFAPEPTGVGLAEKLTTPVGGELVRDEGIGVEHGDAFRCLVVCFGGVVAIRAGVAVRSHDGDRGGPAVAWHAESAVETIERSTGLGGARRQPRTRVAARAQAGTPVGLLQVMLMGRPPSVRSIADFVEQMLTRPN